MNFRFTRLAAGSANEPLDTSVTFYDNYVPTLKDGLHTVTVSQTLAGTGVVNDPPIPNLNEQIPAISQQLFIKGPRFVLDPADIHRVFPANNATGLFTDYLPMVVLNKRALPWERDLNLSTVTGLQLTDHNQYSQYPWMALLVFTPDELVVPGCGNSDNSQQNLSYTTSLPLTSVVAGGTGTPAGTLGPTLTEEHGAPFATTYCDIIDVSVATFASLAPTLDDARYLTHVRNLATDAKEPLQMVHDGWFANIVANRHATPASAGVPQRNVAHIVSLEGHESHFNTPANLPAGTTHVRLISLYNWTFNCLEDPDENFPELMEHLVTEGSEQGTKLLLQMPVPESPPGGRTGISAQVAARLQAGYVPLSYATWSGDQTFAWYRGPLTPEPTTSFLANNDPGQPLNPLAPRVAADAMVYDPVTGIFDQSYAVAFQTGRSLAIANKPFSTNLLQWRRTAHGLIDLLVEYLDSPTLRPQFTASGLLDNTGALTATGIADLAALLNKNLLSVAFKNLMATEFYDSVAIKIGQAGGFVPVDATQPLITATAATTSLLPTIQQLLQNPDVARLLAHLSGLDTLGTTAAPLVPGVDSLILVDPGVSEALIVGSVLQLTSPDGMLSASLRVSQTVIVGATAVPVLSYTGASLPTGSVVQLGSGQLLTDQLVQWLAQTALLYEVPFNNLVPDARLLPQESIRFFYLDENWLNALLDGALSIGLQSSRDSLFQQVMRDALHRAVTATLSEVRDALRGNVSGGAQPAGETKAGFLLRSQAVMAWPGLEIRGWADAGRTTLLKPLRLDRVGPGILLVLFPEVPVVVDIQEPGEGLVFGFKEAESGPEDLELELRYVPGAATTGTQQVGLPLPITPDINPVDNTALLATKRATTATISNSVYNIAGTDPTTLVGLLSQRLFGNSSTLLTPASLAVQLVRVPAKMQFATGPSLSAS